MDPIVFPPDERGRYLLEIAAHLLATVYRHDITEVSIERAVKHAEMLIQEVESR